MSHNRRGFLKNASAVTLGCLAGNGLAASSREDLLATAAATKRIGLQAYSLREELPRDVSGWLKRLRTVGYSELELFGFNFRNDNNMFGGTAQGDPVFIAPGDYKKMADDAGIKLVSSHLYAPFEGYTPDTIKKQEEFFKIAADVHAGIGVTYILQGGMHECENMDQVKFQCDMYNRIGELVKQRGVRFGYHNHSGEFRNIPYYVVPNRSDVHVPGRFPHVDCFQKFVIEGTDPDLVFFELDVYWTVLGDNDPIDWLSRYPDRFELMHIKDRWIVGASGLMNFENIFKKAYEIGIKHFFIEVEDDKNPDTTQWQAVEASAKYILSASFVR